MSQAQSILHELVAIDSTSHRSNLPIVAAIARRLEAAGFELTRLPYRDSAGVEKVNLLARAGPAGSGGLALVGHTDAVPFDPAWEKALTLEERDGRLYGRGACDTKGFVAAALEASSRVDLAALKAPLHLVFTADEEVGCQGAKHLADARPIAPHFAIVGEPTDLCPVRAHKGYALADLDVFGREAHSAYPQSGASAILAAAQLVRAIEECAQRLSQQLDRDFEPPYCTVNVGRIAGGTANNIIAGHCYLSLEWRPLPGQSPEQLLDEVRSAAAQIGKRYGVEMQLRPQRTEAALGTEKSATLVQFLEKHSGQPARTVSYATEAPQLATLGAEAVVFGPGDIKDAHKTGEFVPKTQLEKCADVLEQAIRRFCG